MKSIQIEKNDLDFLEFIYERRRFNFYLNLNNQLKRVVCVREAKSEDFFIRS
jgi:hypothetical protein